MSESMIVLSFAELAFLTALNGESKGRRAAALLGVPLVAADDSVAQAGLSSLALRGLAGQEADELVLDPRVAAVMQGLLTFESHATVATGPEISATVQLMVGRKQSLSIRPMALGCFQFDGLRPSCKLEDLVVALLVEPTEENPTAVRLNERATITVTVQGDGATLSVDSAPPRSVPATDLATEIRSAVRVCLKDSN